uniref:Carboxyl terminus of HSC70-interacting protein n=1 Tax=Tanacetum cinerariifolium TaxID=118510 RepID=A0A6L2NG43_TANCI|nr:carboxyl terminus of HSC70-interacting protein [Tanacetum cinerariifolium]
MDGYTQRRQCKSYNIRRLEKVKLTPKGNKTYARNSAPRSSFELTTVFPSISTCSYRPKRAYRIKKEVQAISRNFHHKSIVGCRRRDFRRLLSVFSKAGTNDVPIEILDYLSCKNILDIFRGPVISPSEKGRKKDTSMNPEQHQASLGRSPNKAAMETDTQEKDKNKAKNDKTKHAMEKIEKDKVIRSRKSKVKARGQQKSTPGKSKSNPAKPKHKKSKENTI